MKKKIRIIILITMIVVWLLFLAQYFYLKKYICEFRCKEWLEFCRYEELIRVCTEKSKHVIDYFACVETSEWTICWDILN